MNSAIKTSLIIPCFNRVDRTAECWKELRSSLAHPDGVEVIFVDDGSTDETAKFLAALEQNSEARVIRNETNLGFAKACNQGAAQAGGEFLVFLNNDIVPLKGWLEPLVELLTAHSDIGVVGARLIYPDGRIQHAGIVVKERSEGNRALMCDHVYRLSRHDAPWANVEREYQAVTGACMAIRQEVFKRLGGFDEVFTNGFEDVDFCFRARAAGLRVIYCPRSVLVHHESSSQGRFIHDRENSVEFTERWGKRIAADEKETYAIAARPNLDLIRDELHALRTSFDKIQSQHPDQAVEESSLRKPLLRWLGISKTQRRMAADIRALRNAMIHLRRVTEGMAMLLDHYEMNQPNEKSSTQDRADQPLQ